MAANIFTRICSRGFLRSYVSKSQLHFDPLNPMQSRVVSNSGLANNTIFEYLFKSFGTTAQKYDSDSVSCWKCGVTVDLKKVLFCNHCEVVQKPKYEVDFFEIFCLKRTFEVDTRELTKKFRLLQMQLHPDRFSQKSEDERQISAGYSSLLNQAYKTLSSPLERGLYLLQIQGHALSDEGEIIMDPEFLSEIMEINEEIYEVEDHESLQRIQTANDIELENLFRKAADYFRNNDWESARECMAKLKYYSKIQRRIKEIEHELVEKEN
ncbi:iron-sulfur cluster co-chaperone protein HscB-like [Daphnia carinata]|uniref:iron-sulfur cluster co-chaperone protein HscB-like n=1 Tax=Daphnia carinata TaxID=120202 RepID=UPI00257E7B09|nr:iron-sulfur cluster co-chaperone protein HscB-like [Daphnia carinata]XP_057369144.1 iron-sulfur cluster co-chaperone protein HscB-like [Daphnia carinata]XP_059351946.1 iron-sulfur cluster co-chaperone protein HscB-like [Daphnia carinata]